ncbi:hypothetical protein [Dictyobacter kobayashii]|uniref:Uncharacterized protein n=1 Tax=Dictyobacter kobayashii TaxID=2014872 RepID=A0A402AHP2_9CHLR|nr:hypothetical protein [Dictyobacter kobayashii]GCE18638.1 hypothetical protein KDK_24380 [Dictyobacter kobayashii]
MSTVDLRLEAFCSWLCERESEVVGYPGIWFNDPLAEWISQQVGRVCGVEGKVYGPAAWDMCRWWWLPLWAQLFVAWTDKYAKRAMTGEQAFAILAEIERRHQRLEW